MAAVEVAVEAERDIGVEAGLEAPPTGGGDMIVRIAEADEALDAYDVRALPSEGRPKWSHARSV